MQMLGEKMQMTQGCNSNSHSFFSDIINRRAQKNKQPFQGLQSKALQNHFMPNHRNLEREQLTPSSSNDSRNAALNLEAV